VNVRRGGVSFRLDLRVAAVAAALGAGILAALTVSVAVGEFRVPPLDVLRSLTGAGDRATDYVVLELRLPRALTGLAVGAALGVAGATFQDLARNPLVSPDVVGVSGGASLAAVAVIVFGGSVPVPLAALAGALLAGAALYALAWRRGVHGTRLVLVGVGVAAFTTAGVSFVLTKGRIFEVEQAYVWLVGSLNGSAYDRLWPLAAGLAAIAPVLLVLARRVDALALGEDIARGLGAPVERARVLLLAGAVALTGLAVSNAGPIAFVAFVAPHLARRLGRSASAQGTLLLAAATGALLVLVCDLLGRLLMHPTGIPVGIVTSVLAAPYFLLLLRRRTS
jgi:iron complex transport system permease protein